MPTKTAKRNARKAARQGKRPTTQAGAFVREEMRKLKHGGSSHVRSPRQAIAVGLSEARRAGIPVRRRRSRSKSSSQARSRSRRG